MYFMQDMGLLNQMLNMAVEIVMQADKGQNNEVLFINMVFERK